ncbi:MAG: rhomboid family intramembrane serine protease [Firmicutes bacterium]|nr:rhomboid family intramembrane serine protease [Bacillota bacterium]
MDRETRRYWQAQRRQMLRRDRQMRGYGGDTVVTAILIALMAVSYLIERFLPGVVNLAAATSVGPAILLLWSALFPGSLLGLVFAGVFVWIVGSQLEAMTAWWQYLLIFFASGLLGSLAARLIAGGLVGGTFAAFGLAGAYVMAMANRRVGGMAQWALILLAINVVLSGFNPSALAGMLGAFIVGLLAARVLDV